MTDIQIRSDCNQILFTCPRCQHADVLIVPWPVAMLPCPQCEYNVLVEAIVITTHTLSIPRIRKGISEWLTYHQTYNLNHKLWKRMLKCVIPYPEP